MNITTTIVADISRHHDLARSKAAEAITHAMEAGKLLVEVKAGLQHGAWGAWLQSNVTVTPRQAQRYMALAQGKPLPLRAIAKNDTVSHLADQWVQRPAFIPLDRHWYCCASQGGAIDYVVEASLEHPGHFFITRFPDLANSDAYDCTGKPVRGDFVELFLKQFGLAEPALANWHVSASDGAMAALDAMTAHGLAAGVNLALANHEADMGAHHE